MERTRIADDDRTRVIRVGLVVSWLALGAAIPGPLVFRYGTLGTALGLFLAWCLLVITVALWRQGASGLSGDALIASWCATAIVVQLAIVPGPASMVLGLLIVTAFAAAATESEQAYLGVAGGSAVAFVVFVTATHMWTTHTFGLALAFMTASLLLGMASEGTRRRLRETDRRRRQLDVKDTELRAQERELAHLYEVSSAIGTGSSLTEVLPELVGRISLAVGAKVGVVLLFRPEEEALRVMSPIWAAGHTLAVERYVLHLTDRGLAQRVFLSGDGAIDNAVEPEADRFLVDLEADRIAAVPLRIERLPIGVLLVADKSDPFTQKDLKALTLLAAPAAFVLNEVARYEAARATGEKMAELAQMKTDFVSVVSHELRTPLTTIIGTLHTLERPELAPDDAAARDLLATATRQAGRLKKLVEDLLVVSRLDSDVLPVRTKSLAALPFIEQTVFDVPRARSQVAVEVDSSLTRIDADPDHLTRALTNLVENALKYGGPGPIAVRGGVEREEVRIAVVDHGQGIPVDRREHIFGRFTQVENPETRRAGGTGLGLSIVRGLTEAMGGHVWFEPTVGGGATFVMALPAPATESGRPPEASLRPESPRAAQSSRGEHD